MPQKIARYAFYLFVILLLLVNFLFTITMHQIHNIHQHFANTLSTSLGGEYSFESSHIKWNNYTKELYIETHKNHLHDSLFHEHNRPLAHIGSVKSTISFWSIFTPDIDIKFIEAHDVDFHLFVDSNGYTNSYLLQAKGKDSTAQKKAVKNLNIQHIALHNVHVNIKNQLQDKEFAFNIDSLIGRLDQNSEKLELDFTLSTFIEKLGFNMEKGPFLENQQLYIPQTVLTFDKVNKTLQFVDKELYVDSQLVHLSLFFDFLSQPKSYDVKINTPQIPFNKGLAFVNKHLRKFLNMVDFEHPLDVNVHIKGELIPKYKPYAKVDFYTDSNLMISDYGHLKNMSIKGFFSNSYDETKEFNDANSIIFIEHLDGYFDDNIPIHGDSIFVQNLKDPYLDAHISAKTDVSHLNSIFGSSLQFSRGNAEVDLHFKGHIAKNKTTQRTMDGHILIKNADLLYTPRQVKLTNINLNSTFKGKDFIINTMSATKGQSKLNINGRAENFFNAYFDNPEAVKIKINLTSPFLDLKDILSLATTNKPTTKTVVKNKKSQPKKLKEINDRIDNLLALGQLNINMDLKKIQHNNFISYNNKVNVDFLQDRILINKAALQHADGHINLNGTIHQTQKNNPFKIKGNIDNVDVSRFFYAMDNFGLESLKYDNLNGQFYSTFEVDGRFTDNGQLLDKSLAGFINFELRDGALVRFGPLAEIGKYVFRNRHLDSISFNKIHNHFIFENGRVIIFPMSIKSSIINIDLQGFYSFTSGTDIAIHIPIFNKDKKTTVFNSKFLSFNLRAKDGEDGKAKIGWDPNAKGKNNLDGFNFRIPQETNDDEK